MTDTAVKFRIPGRKSSEAAGLDWQPRQMKISNVRTYTLEAVRGEAGERFEETAQAGDVVEVELENGLRFWTSPQSLRDEVFAELGVRRGEPGEAFDIPLHLPQRAGERGIGGILIKVLRFFTPAVSPFAADKLAKAIEDLALEGGAGTRLYYCNAHEFKLSPAEARPIPTNKPALLLLHGTGSSTRGSFGELWQDDHESWTRRDSWVRLLAGYETVLALEHRTLTENPVENAITLVNALPVGITLHVMSHSRGGMVGELLCRGGATDGQPPFSAAEMAYFLKNDPQRRRGDLAALNALLQSKRIAVERFVRTACPARGTTLASGRLDIYFSALRAMLKLVPGFPGDALEALAELAAGIASQRSDPAVLPGIEAMIPDSPLVKLLNNPSAKVNGRLRVISGDIEGGTLGSTFLTLLSDPLFQSDHDLVVNTDSMFAGARRTDGAAYVFYRGPEVSHFRYFTNRPSVEKLEAALSAQDIGGDKFTPYDVVQKVEPVQTRGAADTRARHTVFLLPGIMGSHLEIQSNRIWLDLADLAGGGMERLRLNQLGVKEEALVASAYADMVRSLSGGFNVEPFPYDWRFSVTQAAAHLARAIEATLDKLEPHDLPVSIVAHSMGGIVARALIAEHPETWRRMCRHKDARVVMLGTPNGGSHAMGMVLTGQDGLIRRLAMLDFKHDLKELLDIVREFPGVTEMLPAELLDPAKWNEIGNSAASGKWSPPATEILLQAKAVWDKIAATPFDSERFYYIAGTARATPNAVALVADANGDTQVVFNATPRGDGRVTWESGIPKNVRAWYADVPHGDLCKPEKCRAAVIDILRHGDTSQLSGIAPSSRGLPDSFAMPLERAILHPDYEDLLAAALCSTPNRLTATTALKTRVKVVHGSLEFASYPILVGHYRGDTLVSAEADLDRHLGGRLLDAHRLGLYPGETNTAQVFLNDRHQPKGAIVVGLGEVGKLAPGMLEAAVSRGIRAYATSLVDCQGNALDAQRGISVLLVGTNGAGVSVSTAVAAILRGIDKALLNLEKHHLDQHLVLEEVELIEIYQDRAIHAAHALLDATRDEALKRRFELDGSHHVVCRRGGRRRASCEEAPDWWQRLSIQEDPCGKLTFDVLTDRARAESYLQPSQRKLVDQLIEEALSDLPPANKAASTLFQMLTPNNLKQYAPDQRNLLLVLNEASARYPWELMVEGKGDNREPLSVRGGMVRQLQTGKFREKVMHATEKNILIVGNPKLGLAKFPDLPGAAEEAREVDRKLAGYSFNTTTVIESEAKAVMEALYDKEYLILHLSGHGVYRHPLPDAEKSQCNQILDPVSGMVIGDGLFLTPAEIRQMTVVPELTFINCCNLGKIEDPQGGYRPPNLPALAANLGAELIGMGVRAVVAAGWAVDDQAAKEFANVFYDAMLSGKNFGEAVREARKAIYTAFPNHNTWGAYQCYGDPSYVLGNGGKRPGADGQGLRFVHPGEAVTTLDNITEAAATLQDYELHAQKKRVRLIEDTLPPKWLEYGEILTALARAWGELGDFRKAVDYYALASTADNAQMPLQAYEQMSNLRARLAVETFEPGAPEKSLDMLEQSAQEAALMLKLGKTFERLIMLGSVHKRRALIYARLGDTSALKKALAEMKGQYAEADGYYRENNRNKIYPYPLLYSLAAEILLAMQQKPTAKLDKPDIGNRLQTARAAGLERDRETPCYWDAITSAECDLLEGVAEHVATPKAAGTIDANWIDKVAQAYQCAQKRDGSPRELRSVREHLEFLTTIAKATKFTAAADALLAIKEKIA